MNDVGDFIKIVREVSKPDPGLKATFSELNQTLVNLLDRRR